MKNTNAVFLIILGSFLLATGFAFAGENVALSQAQGWLNKGALTDAVTAAGGASPAAAPAAPAPAPAAAATTPPAVPNPTTVTTPPAEPKPTLGERMSKFLQANRRTIFMTGIGAYMAFALIGTGVGALLGGLLFFMMATKM